MQPLEVTRTGPQRHPRSVAGHDEQADPVTGAHVVLGQRGGGADGQVEGARGTVDAAGDPDVAQAVDDEPHACVLLRAGGDDVELAGAQ